MTQDTIYDLIIIGAGPAGIEASIQSKKAGLNALLLDKDRAGETIARTMMDKLFLHVYGRNTGKLLGNLAFPDRAKGSELIKLWDDELKGLPYIAPCNVTRAAKDGDIFKLQSSCGELMSKKLLLSFGIFDHPQKLGVPGEDKNPKVKHEFSYLDDYYKQNIMVVGGGNSALETTIKLAPDNDITLVVRKDCFAETATPKNLKNLDDLVKAGNVKILYQSNVLEIKENEVIVNEKGNATPHKCDVVFIHVGYQKPTNFLKNAGVALNADDKPIINENFETNVAGLFVVGSLAGADSIVESANQAFVALQKIKS